MKKNEIVHGFFWKSLEQYSIIGIQFILQLILARLLEPAVYGVIAIVSIYISLANVFIQNGFSVAIVQQKDISQKELSTVFYFILSIALILYALIFLLAPYIGIWFNMPELKSLLRVMGVLLFIGAFNSIQHAILQRKMQFKLLFISSFTSVALSGIIAVTCAIKGFGVWALAIQQIIYFSTIMIILLIGIKWKPNLFFELRIIKNLISFGWKVLIIGIVNEIFVNLRSIMIGLEYNSSSLAFFSRGKQFPDLFMKSINGSLQAVLLPALVKETDNIETQREILRKTIQLSSYITVPVLIGLSITAPSIVHIILTDKWMPCVIYIQIFCIYFATWPISSSHSQALYALGKSNVLMKIEISRKTIDFIILLITMPYGVHAIAWGVSLVSVLTLFFYMIPNIKLLRYSVSQQISDIIPNFLLAIVMGIGVLSVFYLTRNYSLITLLSQVVAGIIIYVVGSIVTRNKNFKYIFNLGYNLIRR